MKLISAVGTPKTVLSNAPGASAILYYPASGLHPAPGAVVRLARQVGQMQLRGVNVRIILYM